jgi:protein gp37
MSKATGIEWTQATWNPWRGCTKVSAGCDLCYMFREQERYGNDPTVVTRSKTTFTDPLKWADGRLIFTCSWSDWFHEDADPWRDEAWDIVRRTPQHTYQILTKRPGRIQRHLPSDWGNGYPNVWLGTSIEHQATAFRARQLLLVPSRMRFISAEPLIGPLTLNLVGIRWLIVGGESGPGCRPMDPQWAATLRDQCRESGTALFLKQLGGHPDKRGGVSARLDGVRWTEMPTLAPTGEE